MADGYRGMDHLQYVRACELGFSEGYYLWRDGRTGPVIGYPDGKPVRIPPPQDTPRGPLSPYVAYEHESNRAHAKRIKVEGKI
uniref:Uncharacterized protein n=1 Tax=viral metagenome TaxID=1070528 RepID=A0A6M3LP82_9ZZZZ